MFEVTDLSLKTLNMRTQVGVGRVELVQLTALGGLMVVMRWGRWRRWWSSTQMMTTLGTVVSASLVTATGVR